MNKEFLKSLKWIWICVGCLIWFYIIYSIALHEFYLYKFHNDKQRHGDVCERFRNDCFERVRASLTRGGRFVSTKGYDELPKLRCPDDCLWYTEERWYFIDKNKQAKYFENKIKECERELKKCRKENKYFEWCWEYCDKYGERVMFIN